MSTAGRADTFSWTPSVYYAESVVNCTLDKAWKRLLEYQTWNPTFSDSVATPIRGEYRSEGELVLIKKNYADVTGEPLPEFYVETVKVIPRQHIVWYIYFKAGDSARNFVDFTLSEVSSGVKFNIYYYAQERLSQEALQKQKEQYQALMETLANAFKKYCETNA